MTMNTSDAPAEAMRAMTERWLAVPATEAMKGASESFVASATECQKQTSEFVTSRLEKDREAIASMMACKSPAEAMQVQTAWLQETAQDYSAAAKRMFEIYSSFLNRAGASRS